MDMDTDMDKNMDKDMDTDMEMDNFNGQLTIRMLKALT
jgi:hypothetical protein